MSWSSWALWCTSVLLVAGLLVFCLERWLRRPPPPARRRPAAQFTSRGEAECLRVMRLLFPRHQWLHKQRPRWLLYNYPGRKTPPRSLELDIYCEALGLAIEYQGAQHSYVVPFYDGHEPIRAVNLFLARRNRDVWKARVCKERRVDLICVWYTLKTKHIEAFLRSHEMVRRRRK